MEKICDLANSGGTDDSAPVEFSFLVEGNSWKISWTSTFPAGSLPRSEGNFSISRHL
jgi:hypothetical protein